MIQLSLPEEMFFPLFQDVALSCILEDGKILADAIPLFEPHLIISQYLVQKDKKDFDLKSFLYHNFVLIQSDEIDVVNDEVLPIDIHLDLLWKTLYRPTSASVEGSTLITLPYPYIVPGGRFNEIYYWDSYFTMLGLRVSGRVDIITSMIDNFAWMIDNIGYIPNGNRTYFLSRSQPPFFSLMVELLAGVVGDQVYSKYLLQLRMEYDYWMNDNQQKHTVVMDNGSLLNRYYDKLQTPRTEMYLADIHLSSNMEDHHKQAFYGHIRAACESGWDFSSRWCHEPLSLSSIQTNHILPVDLNCLLFHMEVTLSKAYAIDGDLETSNIFLHNSALRSAAIHRYFWDNERGYFFDFDYIRHANTDSIHAAGIFPLFFGIVSQEQALKALDFMEKHLLKDGGVVTTTISSGQQWDAPNGWAPLQWIAYQAAKKYGSFDLANQIKNRWLSLNTKVYYATGKMMEKYNVEDLSLMSGGGEYPVQDGFGWTNGVFLAMTADN